jgi:hypothetical protein
MLTSEAIGSAWPLAERCDQRNIILNAIPGTPLYEMVVATRASDTFHTNEVDGSFTPDVEMITSIANAVDTRIGDGVCDHTEVLGDLAEGVANALRGHISFARTVVGPAVEDLTGRVAEEMAAGSVSSLVGMEVIVDESPELMTNSAFIQMAEKFSETPFDNPQLVFNLPDQSAEELMELVKTGVGSIDGDVATWLAGKDGNWLMGIYGAAFQAKPEGLDSIGGPTFRGLLQDRICGRDNTIAIFLLANRLLEDPVAGTEMDSRLYMNLMADFRSQAGAAIYRDMTALANAEKNGALVITWVGKKITVNGTVYRKWIGEGGSNEVLYGNLLTNPVKVMVKDIDENAGRFQEEWNKYCLVIAASENNRRFARIKEAYAVAFSNIMSDVDIEAEGLTNNIQIINNKFLNLLDAARESDMTCLYTFSLHLLCGSRFTHTDSEEILLGIEAAKKQNPSTPVDQLATIVYLRYLARWVAKQMVVSSV